MAIVPIVFVLLLQLRALLINRPINFLLYHDNNMIVVLNSIFSISRRSAWIWIPRGDAFAESAVLKLVEALLRGCLDGVLLHIIHYAVIF